MEGSNNTSDRDEKEHGECILRRLQILRGTMAQIGFIDHHAREERSQGERDAKSLAEPKATPRARAITASVKSSRDPVRSTRASSHGKKRTPTTSIKTTKKTTLPIVHP